MNDAIDHDSVIADTSFRPGTWFGVLGDHAAVFLPPSVKDRVSALWELVDNGTDFDELLDALIAGGLRTLPGFLILSRGEDAVRVLVRGTPRAVFQTAHGETVEVDGADTTTWTERTVPGVVQTTLLLEGADAGWTQEPGHRHVVSGGLIRVARVDHPPYLAVPPVVPAPEPPAQQWAEPSLTVDEPAEPSLTVDEPAEPPLAAAAAAVLEEAAPDPGNTQAFEPFALDEPVADPPVLDTPAVDSWPAPAPEDAPVPPPLSVGSWHSPDTESPVAPPAAATAQVPEAPVPSDHDGHTLGSSWDTDQFARQQPGIPGQPPAPSVTARPVARLHFAHGEVIDVDRAVLVGRAPEARRFTSTDQPRLVTVPSPNQEISSTHLEVRPGSGADHGTAVVTDLGSTNGTLLVLPGLGPETLQPGVAVQLLPGSLIDLGDGMTIQITGA